MGVSEKKQSHDSLSPRKQRRELSCKSNECVNGVGVHSVCKQRPIVCYNPVYSVDYCLLLGIMPLNLCADHFLRRIRTTLEHLYAAISLHQIQRLHFGNR